MVANHREPVLCECGKEMVFTGKVTPPPQRLNLMGLIYRCPTRSGEKGCGEIREILLDLFTMTNL